MQSEPKDIYKLTAARTGKDETVYKDLGNFVFSEVYKHMRNPQTLILKLKGIGFWYLRKSRMENFLKYYTNTVRRDRSDFDTEGTWKLHESKMALIDVLRARMKDYEKYIQTRDEIKLIRWQTQTLIIPPEDHENE